MSGGQITSRNRTELFLRKVRGILRDGLLLSAVALGIAAFLSGCSGLVSSANSTGNPPPTTLDVTNVQAASVTTSSSQVVWTTNVPANSSVDYGTTTAYGNSTPVDPTMVTSHQVTISGLAAGTTYYFQVNSTDSKGNHGRGGNKFNTTGFSLSGTITPATAGNGATVALSGPANASVTADSSGNYTFVGLANGTYTITPSHAGFTFTPGSQSMSVNGANVTGANFTASGAAVAPTITTQPTNQAVTAGQTATFAVVAGGTAPLSYQWQKNGANIAGVTSASYTTPATTTADSGSTFVVVVSNSAGTVTSAAATLTVSAAAVAPTITTQPANQTVTAGQTATFAVVAGGTAPLSYQWQKNGANIAGATAASYATPATTTADSGSTFAVVVSNSAGTVTSAAATLTVNAAAVAPTITAQPTNQTVILGQTAAFSVVAGGTAPLSYQWQKNGANLTGATSANYTTPATATSDSGSTFRVVVTNTAGTVTSTAATLTVTAAAVAPTITTQPANQTVTAGQTATFAVVAGGTAPLSYQWQKNGANIAGATSASYTTPATTTADSGSTFAVVVSNSAGTVTSVAATLTVSAAAVAPTITTQPANQTVTAGQTATFTVAAGGTAPLSYQWKKNGANITGATAASYLTPATTTADSGSTFAVAVTNTAGTVTSAAATLTVSAAAVAPTITTQPANQTVTAGQTATFTVVAGGTAPLSYQWQKNGANITGATAASYTTPATTTADSASAFAVVVSNSAGTVTSSAATLTVNPAPAPAIQVSPISFGNDVVGTNLSQALIIKNTGTATLTITQITETGSAFFSVSGFTLPLNVNAGQQTTITVAFLPTSAGLASGNVSITSNAPTSPTSVALSGTGVAATLTLGSNPTSLSFGNVTTGTSSATQNVTITNTGNSNVTISQINFGVSGFTMTGGSAPVTLTPSQNLILTVQFSPTIAGAVNGNISIVSNATGSPAAVPVSGTGVAPVQHSAALTWNASTSTVSGYNIYRSTVSGSGYTKINSSLVSALTYTDSTVQSGTTYFYVTTSVDSGGNESSLSNEVTANIP
jgi:ASPM-SPD-2-Hydin domain-containing protein/centrosomal CEP192-like protein/Ig-like domain-containing protein/immunoglobulin I-set domain protein